MKSIFFDSQKTGYDEDGNPIYDRPNNSEELRKTFKSFIGNGVYSNPSTQFQVVVTSGFKLNVMPGETWIEGAFGWEEKTRALTISSSEAQDRIDRVVLRLDLSISKRNIDLYVLKGTAAAKPIAPTLTRNNTVYELCIADILVRRNSSVITQANITDTRLNNNLCGIVTGLIKQVDTTTLYNQIQNDLKNFKNVEQADFITWFETIKDKLSEDAAGNLQLQIDALDSEVTGVQTELSNKAQSNHKHSAGDITSGALAISRGGTGASTVSAARNNLGLGNTAGPLPISCGGTGASTVAELKDNLGLNAATCVTRDMGKYVDAKSGSDANDGAIDTPYKTIAKALDYFPKNLGGRSVRIILNSSGYTEFNDGITVSGFYNGTLTFEKRSPNNVDTDRAIIRGNIKLSNNDARVILKEIEVVGDNTTHAITVSNTSMVGVKSCKVSGAADYAGIYTTRNGRLSVADTMIHSCDMGIYMYSATALSAETAVNMLAVSNVTTHTSAGYKNRLGYSLNGCIMFAAHNKADLPELGVSNFGYYGLTVIYKDSAI